MHRSLNIDPLFLIYDVARLMRVRADHEARAMGMTRAQWVVLMWLEREPGISQNELACLVEVEPITIGRLVDRLHARGFVERRADPKDRRVRRLHLTEAAKPLLGQINKYRMDLGNRLTAGGDPSGLAGMTTALLPKKAKLLQEKREGASALAMNNG